jgi:hypothetical protein
MVPTYMDTLAIVVPDCVSMHLTNVFLLSWSVLTIKTSNKKLTLVPDCVSMHLSNMGSFSGM